MSHTNHYTHGTHKHTCVAGVHGDEDGTGWVQFDLGALKEQSVVARADAPLDGHDLLGHHRQHLQVDAVELVEAGPGPARRQPLEKLAQSNVVQSIGAVEHHTLERERESSVCVCVCVCVCVYLQPLTYIHIPHRVHFEAPAWPRPWQDPSQSLSSPCQPDPREPLPGGDEGLQIEYDSTYRGAQNKIMSISIFYVMHTCL